jgi:glycosyltransferase involved in cell wall biosynthesis
MKVKFVPFQPHCFAFGGFEIQMLSTLKAVQETGVDVSKLDPWSRDNDFDIIHLWGLDHIHEQNVRFSHKDGKKIVITALFPDFESFNRKLRHAASTLIGPARGMIRLAKLADKIIVVNDVEAEIANRYYKIPLEKLDYIPNIVDSKYFAIKHSNNTFKGLKDYVLCTGNICKRKNQLNLVKACKKLNLNLIIIGHTLLGEEIYGRQVEEEISNTNNVAWIKGLKENSDELIEAYKNCSIFALLSHHEQGPISAYEALAAGCNKLLLSNRRYADQSFFEYVETSNPNSVTDIALGLQKLLESEKPDVSNRIINSCNLETVGKQYQAVYKSLL